MFQRSGALMMSSTSWCYCIHQDRVRQHKGWKSFRGAVWRTIAYLLVALVNPTMSVSPLYSKDRNSNSNSLTKPLATKVYFFSHACWSLSLSQKHFRHNHETISVWWWSGWICLQDWADSGSSSLILASPSHISFTKSAVTFIPECNGERKTHLALHCFDGYPKNRTDNLYLIKAIAFPLHSNQFIIAIILKDGSLHDRYLTVHNLLALCIARNINPLVPGSIMFDTVHELACY